MDAGEPTARASHRMLSHRFGVARLVPSPARIRSTIATIATTPEDLRDLRTFHKAMADTTRLRILRRLSTSSASVGELIDLVDLSQPLVSWHIRTLKAAGLVETRRTGRQVICTLRPEALSHYLHEERALLGLAREGVA